MNQEDVGLRSSNDRQIVHVFSTVYFLSLRRFLPTEARRSTSSHDSENDRYSDDSDHLESRLSPSTSRSPSRRQSSQQRQRRHKRLSIASSSFSHPHSLTISQPRDAAMEAAIDAAEEAAMETDAHMGVLKVEASARVYGRYSKWVLFGA